MNETTIKGQKIKNIVNTLVGFSKDQMNEHQKFTEKLTDLLNLVDSSMSFEESQTLTNSVINSPKGAMYTKDIIACLTLRKISCHMKQRFIKHAFFLMRSLNVETNRIINLNKQQEAKKRIQKKFALGRKKIKLEISLSSKDWIYLLKAFKSWEMFYKFAKVGCKDFRYAAVKFLCAKIEKTQKSRIFRTLKGIYLEKILLRNTGFFVGVVGSIASQHWFISKFSAFHLLKVLMSKARLPASYTPLKRLIKLSIRIILSQNFNEWYRQTNLTKRAIWCQSRRTQKRQDSSTSRTKKSASSFYSSASSRKLYSSSISILPLPKNIHDYIDDMIEATDTETVSYYFKPKRIH